MTLEQKLKQLELAKSKLLNAQLEIAEAGKIFDEINGKYRTGHYFDIRKDISNEITKIANVCTELRREGEKSDS